jgi:two-component system cell cycle response regulator
MHAAIVDPSGVVRRLTAELLTQRGDDVSLFSDAAEALECLRNEPSINLLITSLEVTPISGLELCWHARLAAGPSRPLHILVMSSINDAENLAKALDSGADDLIAKPVSRSMLYAKLRLAERLQHAQLELANLAETDPLSGVLNRRTFIQRVTSLLEMVEDQSQPIWALMLDIDQFRQVNDTQGDEAGDDVIRAVAKEARKFAPVVGRFGADEFGLMVQGPPKEQVLRIAENLRQGCRQLAFQGKYKPFNVTCSIGLTRWVPGDSPKRLLKRAEFGLSDAKAAGTDTVKLSEAAA